MYAATIMHEAHDFISVFLSEQSQEKANKKAMEWLLEETKGYRRFDDFPNDEDWLDMCFSESWSFNEGTVR